MWSTNLQQWRIKGRSPGAHLPPPPFFWVKKKKKKWGVLRNLGMPPLGCGGSNRFSVVGLAEPIPPLFWVKTKNGSFCGILECLHWVVVGVILNVWKTNTNTNCLHPSWYGGDSAIWWWAPIWAPLNETKPKWSNPTTTVNDKSNNHFSFKFKTWILFTGC